MINPTLEFLETRTLLSSSNSTKNNSTKANSTDTDSGHHKSHFPNPFAAAEKIAHGITKAAETVGDGVHSVASDLAEGVAKTIEKHSTKKPQSETPLPATNLVANATDAHPSQTIANTTANAAESPEKAPETTPDAEDPGLESEAESFSQSIKTQADNILKDVKALVKGNSIKKFMSGISKNNPELGDTVNFQLSEVLAQKADTLDKLNDVIKGGNPQGVASAANIMAGTFHLFAALLSTEIHPSKIVEVTKIFDDITAKIEQMEDEFRETYVEGLNTSEVGINAHLNETEHLINETMPEKKVHHGIKGKVIELKHGVKSLLSEFKHDVKKGLEVVLDTLLEIFEKIGKTLKATVKTILKHAPHAIAEVEHVLSKLIIAEGAFVKGFTAFIDKHVQYNPTTAALIIGTMECLSMLANVAAGAVGIAAVAYPPIAAASVPTAIVAGVIKVAAEPATIELVLKGIAAAGDVLGVTGDIVGAGMQGVGKIVQKRSDQWEAASVAEHQFLNQTQAAAMSALQQEAAMVA